MNKYFQTLLGVFLLVVLPAICKPELLLTWPLLVMMVAGALIHLNAPQTEVSELWKHNPNDRFSTPLMVFAATLFSVVSVMDYVYGTKSRPSIFSLWSLIGLSFMLVGLYIRWWTIRTLGKYFTARVHLEEKHEIMDMGPYRYLRIRHPAYLGTFITTLGMPLVLQSEYGLMVYGWVLIPIYIYRIYVEEAALYRKFGDTYRQFAKTNYRLIPFLY